LLIFLSNRGKWEGKKRGASPSDTIFEFLYHLNFLLPWLVHVASCTFFLLFFLTIFRFLPHINQAYFSLFIS